jgi:cation diffusion facilitator family transporter
MRSLRQGFMAAGVGMAVNVVLAIVKIVAGILGNSYALIADGVESTTDVVSTLVLWTGLKISSAPADADHPYGHGKADPIAGAVVATIVLATGVLIVVQSLRELITPHHGPAWFTLVVLGPTIVVKEMLSRFVLQVGDQLDSTAIKAAAWEYRCDAISSLAAFVGISIALVGGKRYQGADNWAALVVSAVIFINAWRILRQALGELMDTAPPESVQRRIRQISLEVAGVLRVEKCHTRKSGLGLLVEIHVEVDGDLSVRRGHEIAHEVTDLLKASPLSVQHVVVHIEPASTTSKFP